MSRSSFVLSLILCFIFTSCKNGDLYARQEMRDEFDNIQVRKIDADTSNANRFAASQDEMINKLSDKYVEVDSNAENTTDKVLGTNKNISIAIIVPTTGKYKSIGNMVVESALLTSANSKYAKNGKIQIYDIGQLPEQGWKSNEEVKRFLNDRHDLVIGSVFSDTTQKLLSVLDKDTTFISFSNDYSLLTKYPNLIVFGVDDSFKFLSLFENLKSTSRRFLSMVLPATKAGFATDKIVRALAEKQGVYVINSQFYQPGDKMSIASATNNVNKSFSTTYFVGSNGRYVSKNFKQEKKKAKLANENDDPSALLASKVRVSTDTIWVDADENDLLQVLDNFKKLRILDKNVKIFTSAILSNQSTINVIENLEQVSFIGYNYQFVGKFNKMFNQSYGHNPNYFAYMTYDILSLFLYLSNEGYMLPKYIYSSDGYRGVLEDFRFTREGKVQRRLGIYNISNRNLIKTFVPDVFYSSNKISN